MDYVPVNYPWEPAPVRYIPHHGWHQGHRHLPRFRPNYFLVWPKDGKRGTTWGRWKDIMSGKGPDIHLAVNGDKRLAHGDLPARSRWARWTEYDMLAPLHDNSLAPMPWARRHNHEKYDFRRRRYGHPDRHTWIDVRWPAEPNEHFQQPRAYQDIYGVWYDIRRRPGGVPNLPGWGVGR